MKIAAFTAVAQADLIGIGAYIAENSPRSAEALVQKLQDKAAQIAHRPQTCRPRDDLAPGLRSAPVGNYLIFFRIIEEGIEVIRVLHGARDLPKLIER